MMLHRQQQAQLEEHWSACTSGDLLTTRGHAHQLYERLTFHSFTGAAAPICTHDEEVCLARPGLQPAIPTLTREDALALYSTQARASALVMDTDGCICARHRPEICRIKWCPVVLTAIVDAELRVVEDVEGVI